PTGRPVPVHVRAQARFLAEPRGGLLLQARALVPPPYPCCVETGAQGSHHGLYRPHQPRSCGSHMVVYARKVCLIRFGTGNRCTSIARPNNVSAATGRGKLASCRLARASSATTDARSTIELSIT